MEDDATKLKRIQEAFGASPETASWMLCLFAYIDKLESEVKALKKRALYADMYERTNPDQSISASGSYPGSNPVEKPEFKKID